VAALSIRRVTSCGSARSFNGFSISYGTYRTAVTRVFGDKYRLVPQTGAWVVSRDEVSGLKRRIEKIRETGRAVWGDRIGKFGETERAVWGDETTPKNLKTKALLALDKMTL
jgi:hypothetical protein